MFNQHVLAYLAKSCETILSRLLPPPQTPPWALSLPQITDCHLDFISSMSDLPHRTTNHSVLLSNSLIFIWNFERGKNEKFTFAQ